MPSPSRKPHRAPVERLQRKRRAAKAIAWRLLGPKRTEGQTATGQRQDNARGAREEENAEPEEERTRERQVRLRCQLTNTGSRSLKSKVKAARSRRKEGLRILRVVKGIATFVTKSMTSRSILATNGARGLGTKDIATRNKRVVKGCGHANSEASTGHDRLARCSQYKTFTEKFLKSFRE